MTDEATTETTGGIHVGGNIQIDGYYDVTGFKSGFAKLINSYARNE